MKLSPRYAWEELGQERGLKPPPKWQQIQLSTCFFLADNLYKSLSVVAEGRKFASWIHDLIKMTVLLFIFLNFNWFVAVLGRRCCVQGSLTVPSRGSSLVAVFRLLTVVAQALGVQASGVGACTGWAASRHVESFLTRDQTHVHWIRRWVPNPWTTRQVLQALLKSPFSLS